jgi:hypothetical protein
VTRMATGTATPVERSLPIAARLLLLVALGAGLWMALADPFTVMFFGCYAAAGWVLVVRRPRSSIGWLMLLIAFGFIGTTSRPGVDVAALEAGTASAADFTVAWMGTWSGPLAFTGFLAIALVFPSGHLPAGQWRVPSITVLSVAVAATLLSALQPRFGYNPDGGPVSLVVPNRIAPLPDLPFWEVLSSDILTLTTIMLMIVGVASMFDRYRRSTGIVRLQMRWLVASITAIVAAVVTGLVLLAVFGDAIGGVAWLGAIVAYPSLPIAIVFAILRYRLYEIDRIVSRAIGWAVVTTALAAVFAGTIVGLQALLAPFTANNTLAVAASTLVAAALFQPLRARVQRTVDRRFNRARVDAQGAIETFGAHLRDDLDLTALHGRLLVAVDATVRPDGAGLWIRGRETAR